MNGYNYLKQWLPPRIKATGLSIEMFARKVDLSRAQVYKYLGDRSRPTTDTMARICKVLDVPLSEGLSQYSDNPNGRPKGSSNKTNSVRVRGR